MAKVPVQFTLNGEEKAEFVDSGATLLKALRDKLGDTSPKGGCHQGTCGACSVMIDGELKLSCLTLAETCDGADIVTNGGLAKDGVLHPLQRAFMDEFRGAVRLLHAGHDHGRQGAARPHAEPVARRCGRGALGQYLPLHRLRADHPRRADRRPRQFPERGLRRVRWNSPRAISPTSARTI